MEYISTPRYQIAINGDLHGNIKGRRGLRQGDPISPLLFVMCMEYYTRLMQWVSELEGFEYHTGRKGLKLNHMYFADDMLVFCKGEFKLVLLMLRGLRTLSVALGL